MLPQSTMFDLFQRHRVGMLTWMHNVDSETRSRVLQRVVRLVTASSGDKPPSLLGNEPTDTTRPWIELPVPSYVGCWLPEAELADWKVSFYLNHLFFLLLF